MKTLRLLATVLLSLPAWATMHPQYSSYVNYTSNDGVTVIATAVVDGTTTGCNLPPYCINVVHTPKVWVSIGGSSGWQYGSPVPPANYLSLTNTQSAAEAPNQEFQGQAQETIACSFLGSNFYNATQGPDVLSFGNGRLLLANLSGSAGIPGTCITKGGIEVCDFNVREVCTNTPLWTTNTVTDQPPGLAGWWTDYWCLFYYSTALVCRPTPGTAEKVLVVTPTYCPNPAPS